MLVAARPSPAARRLRPLDLGLAAAALVAGQAEAFLVESAAPTVVVAGLSAVVAVTLAFRREWPLAVLAVMVSCIVALIASGWEGEGLAVFVPTLIASATAGAEVDAPRTYLAPLMTVGVFLLISVTGLDPADAAADYAYVSVLYGGAWALGRAMHDRSLRLEEAAARAERLEHEREERAAAAVAQERARMARELHDIVSHSITVVALQSQAVRRRLGDEHPREAADLEGIEITARQAMAEMRRLLGVLRPADDAPLAPQPGLSDLPNLLGDVSLEVDGEPVALPPGIDLAAYRIVQEALTNVRKHAPGSRPVVALRYGERALEVDVRQDRPGAGGPLSGEGAGAGLVGMRERAVLYGGSLSAGPDERGCFRVHAWLPFREGA